MARHAGDPVGQLAPRAVRRYIYSLALAAGPVVLFYGLASAQEVIIWTGAIGSVLGLSNGLALANVPGGKA